MAGTGDLFPKIEGSHISVRLIKPGAPSDATLTRAIVTAWVEAGLAMELSEYHTRINVEAGRVTLSGGARNDQQKRQLRSLAGQIAGIGNVDDQLQVGK